MFKLTKSKFKALSEICVNFSAVFLASLVVPVFLGGFKLSDWLVVLFGIILMLIFMALALIFADRGKL